MTQPLNPKGTGPNLHVQLELLFGGPTAVAVRRLRLHRILQPLQLLQAGRQRLRAWDCNLGMGLTSVALLLSPVDKQGVRAAG